MAMDTAGVRATLVREHDSVLTQREQLRRDLDDVIAATIDVATDDEHDPEGATIAYERSRTKALLKQADAHLAEIARALDRIDNGSYGICDRCSEAIAPERLAARPAVQTCITCSSR
jgi:RNA polymerase-binding transcription factor DksA